MHQRIPNISESGDSVRITFRARYYYIGRTGRVLSGCKLLSRISWKSCVFCCRAIVCQGGLRGGLFFHYIKCQILTPYNTVQVTCGNTPQIQSQRSALSRPGHVSCQYQCIHQIQQFVRWICTTNYCQSSRNSVTKVPSSLLQFEMCHCSVQFVITGFQAQTVVLTSYAEPFTCCVECYVFHFQDLFLIS